MNLVLISPRPAERTCHRLNEKFSLTSTEQQFSMLNVRSGDDRSTAARIRDAAITCIATNGAATTTVRMIAAEAEVSPGLVIHHYGSMDALRVACDEHIVRTVRELKTSAMAEGLELDFTAALRTSSSGPPLLAYLAKTLADGTPPVAAMVQEMVEDAVAYTEEGVQNGVLTPTEDAYGRAAVLTIWSLGALVLHDHLQRLLGVDLLADPAVVDPAKAHAYFAPAIELYSNGLLTEQAAERFNDALRNSQTPATPEKERTDDRSA
jgi:AcrR family transcriptional regulator